MLAAVKPADLTKIGVGEELAAILSDHGIETVPQLTAQTKEGLRTKIGDEATGQVVFLLKKNGLSLRLPNWRPGVAPEDARRIATEAMRSSLTTR